MALKNIARKFKKALEHTDINVDVASVVMSTKKTTISRSTLWNVLKGIRVLNPDKRRILENWIIKNLPPEKENK